MENVSSAPMWNTEFSFIPFSSAKENTPGDGKPMSAWPTSTNFTVAVPSDGPGCISVSTPLEIAHLLADPVGIVVQHLERAARARSR